MVSRIGEGEIETIDMEQKTPSATEMVVCARNIYASYGTEGKKNKYVLNGLNMNVEKGTIYGILGSSGCGKTTLLNCIAGVKKIDSGSIWVLGGYPGEEGSGVPGPSVGYMPQDLSLMERFTISENLRFFGMLCGRDSDYVKARTKELIELLDLPTEDRWVRNLSGGQRRRVSLAIALLHGPQLLILDEPTVGVDPLLRLSIWEHLVKVSSQQKVTVIITTHYIEEAKEANRIGLLRNGVLLAEDRPDNLLSKYNASSLEDVFLKLARDQNHDAPTTLHSKKAIKSRSNELDHLKHTERNITVSKMSRILAILWKLILDTIRNPSTYFFVIALPVIQISLFCVTIGPDPKGLHIGIVNDEIAQSHFGSCENFMSSKNLSMNVMDGKCMVDMLSCEFLKTLQNKETQYKQEVYSSLEAANKQVKRGNSWGTIYFSPNFTVSFLERLEHAAFMSEQSLNASEIQVTLDMSNESIGRFVQRQLLTILEEILEEVSKQCGFNPRALNLPVKRFPDVYGVDDTAFVNFVIPGILGVIGFMLSSATTGTYILMDKIEGISERTKVCGLRNSEAYAAYIILNLVFTIFQAVVVMLVVFGFFQQPNKGSLLLIYFLLLMQGITGLTFGLFASTISGDMTTFNYISVGYNFTGLYISGCNWPIEGMHWALKPIAKVTHFTLVINAFRSVMYRGWDLTKSTVYIGFATQCAWIIVHIISVIALLKRRKLE